MHPPGLFHVLAGGKQPMKTIRDIARIAGVSVATVSKVINHYPDISEKTRRRVLEVMRQERV